MLIPPSYYYLAPTRWTLEPIDPTQTWSPVPGPRVRYYVVLPKIAKML
jgi:hypothetical protein